MKPSAAIEYEGGSTLSTLHMEHVCGHTASYCFGTWSEALLMAREWKGSLCIPCEREQRTWESEQEAEGVKPSRLQPRRD